MSVNTGIEWCTATWNPVVGCQRVSVGCENCYAERTAKRLKAIGVKHYQDVLDHNGRWNGNVALAEHKLKEPLSWKTPQTIFVNSMGDLFHRDVPVEWVDAVIETILDCPQHTFIVLTKRPDDMYFYFRKYLNSEQHMVDLPIQNLAIGVSVEHDAAADIRLPVLLATPARWRFVSYEPALGPVDFRPYISHWEEQVGEQEFTHRDDCLCGGTGDMGLHGIIMGGESGKNARPMHPDWARSTRDACADAGVNFFFKQWGEWLPGTHFTDDIRARDNEDPAEASKWPCMDFNDDGLPFDTPGQWCDDLTDGAVWRVGKRLAGRLLDGREHNELPWAAA